MLNRDQKGFPFELEVQKGLDSLKVPFLGNPQTFEEWKKNKGKGADIILSIAEVECKFLTKKVYPSWILKDYVTRFKFNRKYAIVVVNYKWFIPSNCRKLLYSYHIKVMDKYEFLWFIVDLFKKANKFVYKLPSTLNLNYLESHHNGLIVKHLGDYG